MHTVGLRNVSDELLHVGSDSVSDVSAAGSVCNIGRGDPSRHQPPHCEPGAVGILRLLGGRICHATASRYAKHQGMYGQ